MQPFLAEMARLAERCDAQFTVILDGPQSQERWRDSGLHASTVVVSGDGEHTGADTIVQTAQTAVREGTSEYVCFIDEDERCADELVTWLAEERYREKDFWHVPRVWLYPDRYHYIRSWKHWPDLQLRIGRRARITIPTDIHVGWMRCQGTLGTAPPAIEHHKCLIRSFEERQATVAEYEARKPGAGMPHVYLPENIMVDVAEWHG